MYQAIERKCNAITMSYATMFDDPYQFFGLLHKKVLVFRQCGAVWFTWQHLNTEVPLLITLIISDRQLLIKLNLYL